ncbi:TPA: trypsin-like peptidase domain-containing protein [Klebsiella pneumoniae]|nr:MULTISPECIES: trypsin-like peptidase domain-containing protein [Klebsiella]MBG2031217.1 trypsin-like peptidase domain-containing protein [Klebsiella pneumoniae]UAD16651.1 serine protease [Klebsiella quasipneumoniae]HBQ3314568.1 trypsin-like peptidase domain-containing protein [Klebsiella pneumoniae]HDZ1673603.1 trypsin-like peptidase domain-containing protein [Klebsiella pneumoniae]
MVMVNENSLRSLFIEPYFNDMPLAEATAFIIEHNGKLFLITNRHNVTGRNQTTDECLSKHGAIPNKIKVHFNKKNSIGEYVIKDIKILDDDENQLWHEHPALAKKADFVALELNDDPEIEFFKYSSNKDHVIHTLNPSNTLSIIGFPYGKSSDKKFGIWISGFLASDPDINYEGLPIMLVDARTRTGQSGSPVILYKEAGMSMINKGGQTTYNPSYSTNFLGIYSGRLNAESDIGMIWKKEAIIELLDSINKRKPLWPVKY